MNPTTIHEEHPEKITIVVVDDHPLVHQGMASIIGSQKDMALVGTASSREEARNLLSRVQPKIALVDLKLPDGSGMDVIAEGRCTVPDCRFVVLSTSTDPVDVQWALDLGVSGFLLKQEPPEEIIRALRLIAQGRPYMSPEIMQSAMTYRLENDPLSRLTERQRDVLVALGNGLSTHGIAETLFISESTVKKHISEILAKLELNDRTQAALFAVSRGLVNLEHTHLGRLDRVASGDGRS